MLNSTKKSGSESDSDDKNGAEVIPSQYQISLDNSLMTEIYPYLGLWAYLKYWFIDGINKQSLLLLDKTRVNYDSKKEDKHTDVKPKTDAEFNGMLSRFGMNTELTPEQRAQNIANELNEK